ncbi:hypothetical protein AVEN_128217-1 [Araneus ventricosus]|uniref:Uncharacterized protein n=1 Tax=Araneus ventricosus TaxID=182803 RepID=A0A4Y2A182_ARAVE|nr:hypothetical protein AVEN_128217-1 [Araneus ventricosus]
MTLRRRRTAQIVQCESVSIFTDITIEAEPVRHRSIQSRNRVFQTHRPAGNRAPASVKGAIHFFSLLPRGARPVETSKCERGLKRTFNELLDSHFSQALTL